MNKKNILIIIISVFLIGIFVYSLLNREQKPIVLDTTPTDGNTNILETSQISINFDSKIQEKTKNKISVVFDPQINFDSTWLVNTFKIIPNTPLSNNTKYKASVLFNGQEIYKFSFETELFNQADIQKFGPQQSQDDYDYGQAVKKVVDQYPWYTSLPIKTSSYVIYYDFQQQKFAITFLTKQDTDQQKVLIQEALSKLQQIGVPTPIQYYINNP